MHEMSLVQDVVKIVLKHAEQNEVKKVAGVFLRVGEMRDVIDEWMQRFFDHLSKGTVAEGAVLTVERVPVSFRCRCDHTFTIKIQERKDIVCPHCGGRDITMISGREFEIEGISVPK